MLSKRNHNNFLFYNDKFRFRLIEYKDICKSKQISCDKEYAVFQPIKQNYDNETLAKADLKNRHEICVDPLRNDCKDLYNEYRNAQSNTKLSASIVEKLQNYSDLDNAPATHTKIKANYTTVQNDLNKLKTMEQETFFPENNDNASIFFRKGSSEQWRKNLTNYQINLILTEFKFVMKELKYI